MIEYLRCPECEDAYPVNNTILNEEKRVTVYTSHCDYCESLLYHCDGEKADKLSLRGGVKAEPCGFNEDDNLV